ncbi:MAG: 5-carboxymethyl-2-hydroxymuconate Delta-isomerase [Holophaga sp.]|nr:5-carboxymethyl-2-hydroxymuconate Delta-isomerase [Holophaga sp.]
MPHTVLEYSNNIADPADFQPLWGKLHPMLVATAHCRLQDIKSRAYRCEAFRMADGDPSYAFAHLTIRLLEGRDPEALARIGTAALELLKEHFRLTLQDRQCDLTVELTDMRKAGYFKATSVRT